MSFLDQVTDDIVVDWEWTLVARDWQFVLYLFLSLLSNRCFTLSCEFEVLMRDWGKVLKFPNSLDATFQDGISSLPGFWENCAK